MSISMLILVVSPEPGVGGITGWWCASRGVLGTLSCRSMSSVVESWPSSDKSSLPCTLIGSYSPIAEKEIHVHLIVTITDYQYIGQVGKECIKI